MSTIATHVSLIRSLISEHSDGSKYSDQFLFELFKNASKRLQYQKARRYEYLSDWNRTRHCLKLEKAKSHNCDCVEVGCDVLKTVYELPKPMTARGGDLIKVFDLNGRRIDQVTPQEQINNLNDPSRIKQTRTAFSIVNKRVVIWNNLTLPAIEVEEIAEDETEWAGIHLCDPDTGEDTTETCFDVQKDDYPIDAELVEPSYRMVLELLNIPLQLQEDKTNDANENIR